MKRCKYYSLKHIIVTGSSITDLNVYAKLTFELRVEIPMDFRTALNSHCLGMEHITDHNMTKVRYRLCDIADTKTY